MGAARWKRLVILLLGGAVLVLSAALWEGDLAGLAVICGVDLLLLTFLLAGWRQIRQEERDAKDIAALRESQRRHAAQMPREERQRAAPERPPPDEE